MTEIPHVAAIELEAAILGAEIIAFLMQPDADGRHFEQFIALMRNYFHGKGGDAPTQGDLKEAETFQKAYDEWLVRQAAGKEIRRNRSEEHTSELQSIMRISYAVLCLKKKKIQNTNQYV